MNQIQFECLRIADYARDFSPQIRGLLRVIGPGDPTTREQANARQELHALAITEYGQGVAFARLFDMLDDAKQEEVVEELERRGWPIPDAVIPTPWVDWMTVRHPSAIEPNA